MAFRSNVAYAATPKRSRPRHAEKATQRSEQWGFGQGDDLFAEPHPTLPGVRTELGCPAFASGGREGVRKRFPKVCLDLGVVAVYVEAPWLSRHVIEDLGQGFPTLFCEHSSTLIRRPMSTRTMMCPAVGVLQPSGMAM